jgi:hypothetical protein
VALNLHGLSKERVVLGLEIKMLLNKVIVFIYVVELLLSVLIYQQFVRIHFARKRAYVTSVKCLVAGEQSIGRC